MTVAAGIPELPGQESSAVVGALAAQLTSLHRLFANATREFGRANGFAQQTWRGEASDAFRNHLQTRTVAMDAIGAATGNAATALEWYSRELSLLVEEYRHHAEVITALTGGGYGEFGGQVTAQNYHAVHYAQLGKRNAVDRLNVSASQVASIINTATSYIMSQLDTGYQVAQALRGYKDPAEGGAAALDGLEQGIDGLGDPKRRGPGLQWKPGLRASRLFGQGRYTYEQFLTRLRFLSGLRTLNRVTTVLGPVLDGVAQVAEDWDLDFTGWQRFRRTTLAVTLEGGGSYLGAAVGAAGGAFVGAAGGGVAGGAVGGPPGAAVGGAVGGIGGAVVGSVIGNGVGNRAGGSVKRWIFEQDTDGWFDDGRR
jgi:hypothetical protein